MRTRLKEIFLILIILILIILNSYLSICLYELFMIRWMIINLWQTEKNEWEDSLIKELNEFNLN